VDAESGISDLPGERLRSTKILVRVITPIAEPASDRGELVGRGEQLVQVGSDRARLRGFQEPME